MKKSRLLWPLLYLVMIVLSSCTMYPNEPANTTTEHLCDQEYAVSLGRPPQNSTVSIDEPPPLFSWAVLAGAPTRFVVEIADSNYNIILSETIEGCITYLPSEDDWQTVLEYYFTKPFPQTVYWRIRIDHLCCDRSYYSGWSYFMIESHHSTS